MAPSDESQQLTTVSTHDTATIQGDPTGTSQGLEQNELYHLEWCDKEFAEHRWMVLKAFTIPLIINFAVLLICGALLYGAFFQQNELRRVRVFVVDFDGDFLGREIVGAFERSLQQPNPIKLDFTSTFASNQEVHQAVFDEKGWGAVIINAQATQNLRNALAMGNATYDPSTAVELVTEGARLTMTSNTHVLPGISAILVPAIADASLNVTTSFLTANVNDTAELQTALRCPQCLASAFAYTPVDLVPFSNAPSLGAITSGAIFLMVFTFTVSGVSHQIGLNFGHKLSIRSTITFRIVAPVFAYLLIAFAITLMQLAFGVALSNHYGRRGFMIMWMLYWCTVSALGFALEVIWSVFGFFIMGIFLNFWVIWNSVPISNSWDLMPDFYKYGYGFPLFHAVQGTLTIIYGTKSHLGLNFGVLIAWDIVGILGLTMATIAMQKRNTKKGVHIIR